MYALVLVVHVIVCFVLIMVVLLQAGRGGGFSDMLGGGQPQSLFGTQTNAFMMKATEACAVIFIITSLTLGIMSSHKGRSLIGHGALARDLQSMIPAVPPVPQAPQVPVTASEPISESSKVTADAVAQTVAAAPSTSAEANAK